MTNLEAIVALPEVATVREWNGRHYINFANLSRTANGDRNLKVWIKGDTITREPYKGYLSDAAGAGLVAIEALATERGLTFVRR